MTTRLRTLVALLLVAPLSACSLGAADEETEPEGTDAIEAVELPDGLCAGVDPEVVESWDLSVDAEETTRTATGSVARCEMSGATDDGTTDLVVELETYGGADRDEQQRTVADLVDEECDELADDERGDVDPSPTDGCRFSIVSPTRDAAEVVQVSPTGLQLGGTVRIAMTRDGNQAQLLLPQVSGLEGHFVLSEPDELLDPDA